MNDMFSIIWAAMQPTYSNQQKCIQRINDKNDSKDNSKDYSNIKSSCIRDNIPFLFSFGFILANSCRNYNRQEQNNFHFAWQNFSVFRSCWLFLIECQFLTSFDLTEKILCNFIWRKNYIVQFRISRFLLKVCM